MDEITIDDHRGAAWWPSGGPAFQRTPGQRQRGPVGERVFDPPQSRAALAEE
jgi:hypothetical protein